MHMYQNKANLTFEALFTRLYDHYSIVKTRMRWLNRLTHIGEKMGVQNINVTKYNSFC